MRHRVSPTLRCAARSCTVAALAFALGCGTIDRLTGVSDARELRASGVAAEAEVLSLWDTGITVNQDPVIGLKVEVRPADRPSYQATIEKSLVSRLDVPRFQPGRIVPVRFDPRNPARVAIDLYGEGPAPEPADAGDALPASAPASEVRLRGRGLGPVPRTAAAVEEIKDWMEANRVFGYPSYLEADLPGLRRLFVIWNIPTSGLNVTDYWIYCRRSGAWTLLEASQFQPAEDQTHYAAVDSFDLEVRFFGPRGQLSKTVSVASCTQKPGDPDYDPARP